MTAVEDWSFQDPPTAHPSVGAPVADDTDWVAIKSRVCDIIRRSLGNSGQNLVRTIENAPERFGPFAQVVEGLNGVLVPGVPPAHVSALAREVTAYTDNALCGAD